MRIATIMGAAVLAVSGIAVASIAAPQDQQQTAPDAQDNAMAPDNSAMPTDMTPPDGTAPDATVPDDTPDTMAPPTPDAGTMQPPTPGAMPPTSDEPGADPSTAPDLPGNTM